MHHPTPRSFKLRRPSLSKSTKVLQSAESTAKIPQRLSTTPSTITKTNMPPHRPAPLPLTNNLTHLLRIKPIPTIRLRPPEKSYSNTVTRPTNTASTLALLLTLTARRNADFNIKTTHVARDAAEERFAGPQKEFFMLCSVGSRNAIKRRGNVDDLSTAHVHPA